MSDSSIPEIPVPIIEKPREPEKVQELNMTDEQKREAHIMFHELLKTQTDLLKHVGELTNQVNELTKQIKK